MKRNLAKLLVIGLAIVLAVFAAQRFLLGAKSDKGAQELIEAPIWADLQSIEFQHRFDKDLRMPMLLKGSVDSGRYDVLGVSSTSKTYPYVWIVLNSDGNANKIFMMPENIDFVLPCKYLKQLRYKERVGEEVGHLLTGHCVKE